MSIFDGGPGPRVDAEALAEECAIAAAEDQARDDARAAAEAEKVAADLEAEEAGQEEELLPEQCDECETTGYNCSMHDGPEWRDDGISA